MTTYEEQVTNDVIDFIHDIRENSPLPSVTFPDNRAIGENSEFYDDLEATVTGNADGSYFMNALEALVMVSTNLGTVADAYASLDMLDDLGADIHNKKYEQLDVIARIYTLANLSSYTLTDLETLATK